MMNVSSDSLVVPANSTIKNIVNPPSTSFIGGAVAGVSVDLALYPLDTLKTRLQSQYGFWDSGGFKKIYKGVGPTSVGSPLSGGLFLGTYETSKKLLLTQIPERYYPVVHMCSASFGEVAMFQIIFLVVIGGVAAALTTPLDVVKTQIMLSENNYTVETSHKTAPSIFVFMRSIYREHGIKKLFAGFIPRVIMIMLGGAIFFGVYDESCKFINSCSIYHT